MGKMFKVYNEKRAVLLGYPENILSVFLSLLLVFSQRLKGAASMNKIRQNIPNAITCGNLFCGCLALVKAFEGDLVWAACLVGIAAILDFLDGLAARLLKVSSPIGKDLDSLADMVTFGVVPGVVMFQIMGFVNLVDKGFQEVNGLSSGNLHLSESIRNFVPYLSFLIPIFSAVRLAKFNHDDRQTNSFIGVPTPANAIFICSIPLIFWNLFGISFIHSNHNLYLFGFVNESFFQLQAFWSQYTILSSLEFYAILTILLSYLLIASLPLFSLKFKSFGWKGNEIRYVFLGLSLCLLVFLQFVGIPLVIVLYILLSVVNNLFFREKKNT